MLEKVEAVIDKLNSDGIEFTKGQHAIVCKDGVIILDIAEDGCGVIVVNNRLDVDHTLGITDEEVAEFNFIEALGKKLEEG